MSNKAGRPRIDNPKPGSLWKRHRRAILAKLPCEPKCPHCNPNGRGIVVRHEAIEAPPIKAKRQTKRKKAPDIHAEAEASYQEFKESIPPGAITAACDTEPLMERVQEVTGMRKVITPEDRMRAELEALIRDLSTCGTPRQWAVLEQRLKKVRPTVYGSARLRLDDAAYGAKLRVEPLTRRTVRKMALHADKAERRSVDATGAHVASAVKDADKRRLILAALPGWPVAAGRFIGNLATRLRKPVRRACESAGEAINESRREIWDRARRIDGDTRAVLRAFAIVGFLALVGVMLTSRIAHTVTTAQIEPKNQERVAAVQMDHHLLP